MIFEIRTLLQVLHCVSQQTCLLSEQKHGACPAWQQTDVEAVQILL